MKTSYSVIQENILKTYILMSIFIGIILLLGYFIAYIYNEPFIFYFALLIGILMNFGSYFYGHKIIVKITGAKKITKDDLPTVYRILENLSITAGLPKTPDLYIIETPAMNAFATGRDYKNSLVAVTSGLVNNLTEKELEGVIAHELAHIKNRDITVMMISSVLMGIIAIIADILLRSGISSKNDNNKSNAIFFIIGIILIFLAPIFAQLTHLAISRKREFMADATGILFTRNPEGLASALEKLSNQKEKLETSPAVASLFIINPFKNQKNLISWLGNLFSTHPPIEKRIEILRNMVI
ncbi:MAG: protease HtpX [Candidatus Parcubacteria bacterium]|nr:MAG: protease HtpX [Candidatus Parcubacteria bacterium]